MKKYCRGWKISPCLPIKSGETVTLMDHDGPGVIRHMWITFDQKLRRQFIIRIYWDGQKQPSVECPIGDFMCQSWNRDQNISSLAINVNPKGGMNCFFPMPFRRHARITVQNDSLADLPHFFYTINYTLEAVPDDCLYFHAQFRRTNPVPYKEVYTILDGVRGHGHYVGTFMSWQQNSSGWWGEGEIKMYLTGTRSGRRSAAPAPRIISAAPGALMRTISRGRTSGFSRWSASRCRPARA